MKTELGVLVFLHLLVKFFFFSETSSVAFFSFLMGKILIRDEGKISDLFLVYFEPIVV